MKSRGQGRRTPLVLEQKGCLLAIIDSGVLDCNSLASRVEHNLHCKASGMPGSCCCCSAAPEVEVLAVVVVVVLVAVSVW